MTIGRAAWPELLAQAEYLATRGGLGVPGGAVSLTDLPVTGAAEILNVTSARAVGAGSVLMSSGGTTGKPKLTYVPYHQAIDRLLPEWNPLAPGDVLLNLFNPGRMWGSHYYMQTLGERSGCTVVPSGPYAPEAVADWLPMFEDVGLNALAGTPTGLADFAEGVLSAGAALPVRTVIWMAEPWTDTKRETVRGAFPEAGFWGNYGSVETYVIATNNPDCDPDVLHLLPDQIVEPDDGGALLSRVGAGWTMPTVRYRLGDRVGAAVCGCGRPDGLQVLGRADDSVSLRSALFSVGEVLALARQQPGVQEAQLVLTRNTDSLRAASALTLEFLGDADPEFICSQLIREFYHLAAISQRYPGAITAHRVDRLNRVERTNKVPPAVWRD